MRFGIDIDGVVADFVSAFVREINNIWPGRLPINYQPPSWSGWGDLTSREFERTWEVVALKPNWWLSILPYPDNLRAIALHRIRHPEDEIFYITARHEVAGMPTMHQTQTWLKQCGIGGLGTAVIVDVNKDKSAIFNAISCDANIDDKLEAVIEHDRQTIGSFLLDRPWNRSNRPPAIRVVGGLQEFFEQVPKLKARATS
jgi:uncharacterized HAD superfamily protein